MKAYLISLIGFILPLSLSGCSSDDGTPHCSVGNEYSKKESYSGLDFYDYEIITNKCNNLKSIETVETDNEQPKIISAEFHDENGVYTKCRDTEHGYGYGWYLEICSNKDDYSQYLLYFSNDQSSLTHYFTQVDTDAIEATTFYFDSSVEVDSNVESIESNDPRYPALYEMIFNVESMFAEATKEATAVLPKS